MAQLCLAIVVLLSIAICGVCAPNPNFGLVSGLAALGLGQPMGHLVTFVVSGGIFAAADVSNVIGVEGLTRPTQNIKAPTRTPSSTSSGSKSSSSKSSRKKSSTRSTPAPAPAAAQDVPPAAEAPDDLVDGSNPSSRVDRDRVRRPPTFAGPTTSAPNVSIVPPYMDWQTRPLCSPATNTLNVINTHENTELLIMSLSTNNIQYYPSNFRQTTILPGEKISIPMVYLPHTLGVLDATLIIQTNVGSFLVHLYGLGTPSPYQVEPMLGAKVPAGVSYSYSLRVHNPFNEVLKVKEVYTNEDFFRLSLPQVTTASTSPTPGNSASSGDGAGISPSSAATTSSDSEAESRPARLWDIEPHETRTVINLEFFSQVPGKFLGLVHVRTTKDTLILPVDVQAMKGGVHQTEEVIDFGTLTSPRAWSRRSIRLLNSGSSLVSVMDMHPAQHDHHLVLDFQRGTLLKPGQETTVATATYHGTLQGQVSSKILIRTNDTNPANQRLEVGYRVRVLHGSVGFEAVNTTFEALPPPFIPVIRHLILTNHFPDPVVLYSAEVDDRNFEILEFESGALVEPGAVAPPIIIQFLANATNLMYETPLVVNTNITMLKVPLKVYHGLLLFSSPPEPTSPIPSRPTASASTLLSTNETITGYAHTEHVNEDKSPSEPTPSMITDLNGRSPQAVHSENLSASSLDFGVLGVGEVRTQLLNITNLNPVAVDVLSVVSTLASVTVSMLGVYDEVGRVVVPPPGSAASHRARRSQTQTEGDAPSASSTSGVEGKEGLSSREAAEAGLTLQGEGGGDAPASSSNGVTPGGSESARHSPFSVRLEPRHTCVMQVRLLSEEEEIQSGELKIQTFYEQRTVPMRYESLQGTLQVSPSVVRFKGSFPGKVLRKPLWAWSTYQRPLTIRLVDSSDPRVLMELEEAVIPPNTRVRIGQVVLDTARVSLEENYLSDATFAGSVGLSAPGAKLTKLDAQALKRRELVWENVSARGLTEVRATLTLNTDVVRGVTLTARGTLERPSVLTSTALNFSFAQIGSETVQEVRVHNPSDHPLAVRVLPLPLDPNSREGAAVMHAFGSQPAKPLSGGRNGKTSKSSNQPGTVREISLTKVGLDSSSSEFELDSSSESSCSLSSSSESGDSSSTECSEDSSSSKPGFPDLASITAHMASDEAGAFRFHPAFQKDVVVPPHTDQVVGVVSFMPPSLTQHLSFLFVKNNLTLLQTLPMIGNGASGKLVFEDKDVKVRRLEFVLTPALLGFPDDLASASSSSASSNNRTSRSSPSTKGSKSSSSSKSSKSSSSSSKSKPGGAGQPDSSTISRKGDFVFQRNFRAVNRGTIPLHLRSLRIGGGADGTGAAGSCKSSGFELSNCLSEEDEPVTLDPGQSTSIAISYQPDFTASWVRESLSVTTSAGVFSFPIDLTMPHHLLPACLEALPVSEGERVASMLCSMFMVGAGIWFAVVIAMDVSPDIKKMLLPKRQKYTTTGPNTATTVLENINSVGSTCSSEADTAVILQSPKTKRNASKTAQIESESGATAPLEKTSVEKTEKKKKKKKKNEEATATLDPTTSSENPTANVNSTPSTVQPSLSFDETPKPRPPSPSAAPESYPLHDSPPSSTMTSSVGSPFTSPLDEKVKVLASRSSVDSHSQVVSSTAVHSKLVKHAVVSPTKPTQPTSNPLSMLKPSSGKPNPVVHPSVKPTAVNPTRHALVHQPPQMVPKPHAPYPSQPSPVKNVSSVLRPPRASVPSSSHLSVRTNPPVNPANTRPSSFAAASKPAISATHPISVPPALSRPSPFSQASPTGLSQSPSTPDVVQNLTRFLGMEKESPIPVPVNPPLPPGPPPRSLIASSATAQPPIAPATRTSHTFSSVGNGTDPEGFSRNRVGLRDSLSSIGLARLDAESELASKVYNIWGESQSSGSSGFGFPGLAGMPTHHRQAEESSNSFFNFSPSAADDFEALEPDTLEPAEQVDQKPFGGGQQEAFSMFSSLRTESTFSSAMTESLNHIWSNPSQSDVDWAME